MFAKVRKQIPRRFLLDGGSLNAEGRCAFYNLAPGEYTVLAAGFHGKTAFYWIRHVKVKSSIQVILDNDQCIID